MATYDAVVSLLDDLEQHLRSYDTTFGCSDYGFTKKEIKIVYDAVSLMDSFLRDSSGHSYNHDFINQISENRIISVARKAGNYIDFWEVEKYRKMRRLLSLAEITEKTVSINEITEEVVSINRELIKIHHSRKHSSSTADESSTPLRTTPKTEGKGKLIGLDNDLVTLLDALTGQPSQLKVFSITGMAGIGKTTFSKKLYDNPLVVHHFYARAWVTVSQQYQVTQILLAVLRCLTNDDSDDIHTEELREKVFRILKRKRYLLVLDDIWDTKAWDELKRTFPDDNNGSRIILTSRLRDVAIHASKDTPPHCMRCLSRDESWELLSSRILVDESCPKELVDIGKQIAYKCHGLPLTIVAVGGLLSKMDKKVDVWEQVAQSVGSLVMEEAEHCQYVLALSYNHLPDCLKQCFLYMGMFPEDYEISVKKLIWLWIAEGFIRCTTLKSLEEVAEDYLADLTARSLILVKRRSCDGSRIKTCYIHDLMRELCLRESKRHNFLQVINSCGQLPLKYGNYLHDLRRLSFHSGMGKYIDKTSFPYTRSLMSFEKLSDSGDQCILGMSLMLLRVLDINDINLREIPGEHIWNLSQLKFLELTIQSPSNIRSVRRFRLLQTLIIDCEWDGYLSSTFWGMLELRHFHLKRSCQSYLSTYPGLSWSNSPFMPAPVQESRPPSVLNNLKSVSTIRPISCTEKSFLCMPHLKSLGVYETEEDCQFRGWFKRLVLLRELEKLKYVFSNPFVSSALKPDRLPPWQSFPPKLTKLTLSGTSLPWDDMSNLSMLPKLEVLKLRNYAFSGAVWKSRAGGFLCLKYLLIGSTNLETWESDGTDFPNLEHLVLRHCRSLKEIPYNIGEAPLLETIELHRCKNSAVKSAKNLQEEQHSLGNDGLTIYITEG